MNKDKELKIIYIINSVLPNNRAHGIQVVNTCEGINNAGAELKLVTPYFFGDKVSFEKHYSIKQNFKHKRIFSIDIPF